MPMPPAHMLLGAAAAELVVAARPLPRRAAWAVGALVALLPDGDFAFRLLTGGYAPVQRPMTHSLLALLVFAGLAWAIAGRRWSAVTAAAYASHLLSDLFQHQWSTSVAPLWPLQSEGMAPLLPLFPYVPIVRGEGGREAAMGLLREPSFAPLLQETAIAAGLFCAALLIAGRIRRRRVGAEPTPLPDRSAPH